MDNKKKKILGSILSSIAFCSIDLLYLILIIYFQTTETEKLPLLLFIIIMILLSIPLIGIILNLIYRIKEIKSNEEEEASKY